MKTTTTAYNALAEAYAFFNTALFGDTLPDCLITLQRHKGARGYYSPSRFENGLKQTTDEIALNPDCVGTRSVQDTLSTLVHEMVHLWQQHYGTPPRKSYHNKEWGNKMESVGLSPSSDGTPTGARTGQKMTHYVVEGGLFSVECEIFLVRNPDFMLWYSSKAETPKKKDASKTKYTCPDCDCNAWAKPETSLVCGDCGIIMLDQ